MPTDSPRVFISHASEDKDRFVLEFARRLRSNGVDAWVDRWEMLPGDSLVDKIFDEGIKNAHAMIIVLSGSSVTKPWVREELNAGFVKKINGKTKLIPVVIDECEVPEALKSTLWERISDLTSYDTEFARILAAIFEARAKPALGPPPKYISLRIDNLPAMSGADTIVFTAVCQRVLDKGIDWINARDILPGLAELGIPEDETFDSIEILTDKYLISGTPMIGGRIDFFRLTTSGFELYAKYYFPEFDKITKDVLLGIVNNERLSNEDLSSSLSVAQIVVDFALNVLASRGLFKLSKTIGGHISVHSLSPRARRAAGQLAD